MMDAGAAPRSGHGDDGVHGCWMQQHCKGGTKTTVDRSCSSAASQGTPHKQPPQPLGFFAPFPGRAGRGDISVAKHYLIKG